MHSLIDSGPPGNRKRLIALLAIVAGIVAATSAVLFWIPLSTHSSLFALSIDSNCPAGAENCTGSEWRNFTAPSGSRISFSWRVNVTGPRATVEVLSPSGSTVYSGSGSAGTGSYVESSSEPYDWYLSVEGSVPSFSVHLFGNATWCGPLVSL